MVQFDHRTHCSLKLTSRSPVDSNVIFSLTCPHCSSRLWPPRERKPLFVQRSRPGPEYCTVLQGWKTSLVFVSVVRLQRHRVDRAQSRNNFHMSLWCHSAKTASLNSERRAAKQIRMQSERQTWCLVCAARRRGNGPTTGGRPQRKKRGRRRRRFELLGLLEQEGGGKVEKKEPEKLTWKGMLTEMIIEFWDSVREMSCQIITAWWHFGFSLVFLPSLCLRLL